MGRPEKITLKQLQIETCAILIGILWLRFGTPTGEINSQTGQPFESGTEEEFTAAYDLWQKTGRPHIMFYRCDRLPERLSQIDPKQWEKVNAFFTQFQPSAAHPGFYCAYQTPEEFKDRVRQDLKKLLHEFSEKVPQPTSPSPPAVVAPAHRESVEALQRRYLEKLQNYCNLLPLAAIAEERDRHTSARLTLSQVYIGLNTTGSWMKLAST